MAIRYDLDAAMRAKAGLDALADTLGPEIRQRIEVYLEGELSTWEGQAKNNFMEYQYRGIILEGVNVLLMNLRTAGENAVKIAQKAEETDSLQAAQFQY